MRRSPFFIVSFLTVVAGTFCGCAKGPLRGLSFLSPHAQQLLAEEEKIAKSWPTLREEMTAMVDQANKGSSQQQRIAAQRLEEYLTPDTPTLKRLHATDLLGKLPSEYSVNGLGIAAKDDEVDVRITACRSLGEIADRNALMKLREIINSDSDKDVQIAATRALGNIRSPETLASLKEALASKHPALQISATESLAKLTGQDFGRDVPKWEQYLAAGRGSIEAKTQEKTASFGESLNKTIQRVGFLQKN